MRLRRFWWPARRAESALSPLPRAAESLRSPILGGALTEVVGDRVDASGLVSASHTLKLTSDENAVPS